MSSTTDLDTTVRTKYAVRYTWADGNTEIESQSGRNVAESVVRTHSARFRRGEVPNSAEVVTRSVIVCGWEPLGGVA